MNDPMRIHALQVELEEGDQIRARLYSDDFGRMQLQIYDGTLLVIPVDWLLNIIGRFQQDLAAIEEPNKGEQ